MQLLKNKPFYAVLLGAAMLSVSACTSSDKKNTMTDSTMQRQLPAAAGFKQTINGKPCQLYVLKNSKGTEAAITNYGGRLVSLLVPDKSGKLIDVIAGPPDIDGFKDAAGNYYGALIGRYGNRIGKAKFTLEGKEYELPANNGPNTLHGGKNGFDVRVWDARQVNDHTLELTYLSKDGEEGFPGNLTVSVSYTLTEDNAIEIRYQAKTDETTVVNLTSHAYYNLNGGGSILEHMLQLDADNFTPVDSTLIPTGQLTAVQNTPFDFRKATAIGSRIGEGEPQLLNGKGYDHNFVLNKHTLQTPIATVTGDKSGIIMQIFTEEPGIQFYSGNFMKGDFDFKGGKKDEFRSALALETQHYPDSPNKPAFPTTVLKPGDTYKTTTIYKFSVK